MKNIWQIVNNFQLNPVSGLSKFLSSFWTEEEDETESKVVMSQSEVKKTTLVKDSEDPAVVFFPTNSDSDCMDASAGNSLLSGLTSFIIFWCSDQEEDSTPSAS